MKGIEVKKKLQNDRFSMKEIADLMGETPQNLQAMFKVEDIKTGVLERIAKAIGKDILYFYNIESKGVTALDESQLTIEITQNSGKAYRLYQKIVSIDVLLDKKFGIKNEDGYASSAAKILNDTFFRKYDFVVDGMSYEEKNKFNDQLKMAIDSFINIFFDRFKTLSKQLDSYSNR
ncbi:hypothetical protein [Gaoshiqia sp. Z1-71]|uniref:hypothetical protein n=1 Tax=Gaoshiqia hydrogeniformans TaxID=3290090 RepID=UPI003BF862AA